MIRWLNNVTDSMDMNLSKLLETMKDRGAWHTAFHGVTKSQTQVSNFITITTYMFNFLQVIYYFLLCNSVLFYIKKYELSNFFLFKIVLALLGSLQVYVNFSIVFSIYAKKKKNSKGFDRNFTGF